MNLIDFLSMGGQERRKMLDNYVDSLNLERFVPPNLRPATEFIAEANPVAAIGGAMQDASVVFDPQQTAEARKRAAVDMGLEMAMTLAPAALVRMGYLAAPAGLAETFGMSIDNAAENARGLISDATYAARSVAEGDPRGVLEAFQRGGTPQSVGAAGIGDNGGPPLDVVPARAELFSPSLRAAENLKQKKGSYDQMRAMLIKGGAKEDELEWTGADTFFKDKKVTQEDLISYLKKNTDAIKVQKNLSGEGRIGGSMFDTDPDAAFESWFQSYVVDDRPWADQITDEYVKNLADDLYYSDDDRIVQIHDMLKTPEDLENFMSETGFTLDEINQSEWLFDDGETKKLFQYGEELVEELEGREALQNQALEDYKQVLRDEFDYDPESFGERYDLSDVEEGIDVGDTRFSKYMPQGGENYQENLLRYADPQGKIAQDDIASSSHWRQDDEGTIYHTRQADYDIADGGRARYIAEIQSDPQQNLKSGKPAPYEYLAGKGEWDEKLQGYRNQLQEAEARVDNNLTRLREEFAFWAQKNPEAANNLKNDFLIQEYNLTQELLNGGFFDTGDVSNVNYLPLDPKSWTDEQNEAFSDWYSSNTYDLNRQLPLHAARNPSLLNDKVEADIVRGVGQEHLRLMSEFDQANQQFHQFRNTAEENAINYVPSGPFMQSQNRWLDNALRRSIVDAVNDPNVDYLTFPYNREAIGVVGGNTYSPRQGTIDYYQRDTQNRLKKILKGIDPNIQIEDVDLRGTSQSEIGDFNARGFQLTPDFRDRVRRSGLPAWMIAGGLPLVGIMDYLKEQKEKSNERFGGLMGYGGL